LKLTKSRGKTWPDFNIVFINCCRLCRIEVVSPNLFEFNLLEERVKEYLEEDKHVFVLFTNFLDPIDINLVLLLFKGVFKLRDIKIVAKSIDVSSS